jgi:hypothetical protein
MSEIMKRLAAGLNRQYGRVVGRPMPWRMIDALVTLEETLEKREDGPAPRPTAAPVDTPRQQPSATTPPPLPQTKR